MKYAMSLRAAHVALCTTVLVGCRDSNIAATEKHTRATVTSGVQSALQRIHERNPQEKVGREHNRAVERFRAELRQNPKWSRQLCSRITAFVVGDEFVPAEKRKKFDAEGLAQRALGETEVCKKTSASIRKASTTRGFASPRTVRTFMTLDDFANQIYSAVEAAQNAFDLAVLLNEILAQVSSLSPEEADGVYAIASVAQNSFEYWHAGLDAFEATAQATYGDCLAQRAAGGDSEWDALRNCTSGDYTDMLGPTRSIPRIVRVSHIVTTQSECGLDRSIRAKLIAQADVRGAITGLMGALMLGQLELLPQAVFVGAAVGSVGKGIDLWWDNKWCRIAPP